MQKKNNTKKENGITIIALIVSIIVILIITTTAIEYTYSGSEENHYKLMCSDIQILEDKVFMYHNKYGELPIVGEAIDVSKIINSENKFYKLDVSKLSNVTLNYGESSDVFLIDIATLEVYYQNGIEVRGIMYYTD